MRVLRDHYGNKDNAPARMKTYAKIADFASRLYGGAIHEMELTTLFCSQKNWAKRIVDVKKQHHAIQKWVKNKEDEKHFINALAEPFLSRANKINPSRKQAQCSDSDEDDEASGAGSKRKQCAEDGNSSDQNGSDKSDDDSTASSDEKKSAKSSMKGSDAEDSDEEEDKL